MFGLWKTKETEPQPAPFNLEAERGRLWKLEQDANEEYCKASRTRAEFQNLHFLPSNIGLVRRVTLEVVDNFAVDQELARLIRAESEVHEKFQAAQKLRIDLG